MDHNDKITGQLNKLEAHLQSLVEGSLSRLFGTGKNHPVDLVPQLVAALNAGSKTLEDGRVVAPNVFILSANNQYLNGLNRSDEFWQNLADDVHKAGIAAGFIFLDAVDVRLLADNALTAYQVEISAQISLENLAATTDMESEVETAWSAVPENAFFIIDGLRIFSLEKPVINIGRRPDNHLVIDDARISRTHAQLRAIKGRFVIFDLESTGGTHVNGQRINQAVLFPGDVISLAGLPLVYGQEEGNMKETQKYDLSADQDGNIEVIQ
jgi:hypothetical protein